MTEKNNSENKNDEEEFSLFTCVGFCAGTIFFEYATYMIYLGNGLNMNSSSSNAIVRLVVATLPISAPFMVIVMFYTCVLVRKAPYTWLIAQVFALYFIFTKA